MAQLYKIGDLEAFPMVKALSEETISAAGTYKLNDKITNYNMINFKWRYSNQHMLTETIWIGKDENNVGKTINDYLLRYENSTTSAWVKFYFNDNLDEIVLEFPQSTCFVCGIYGLN